ncbi:transposase [Streptomyces sp. WM6386]|uniref:transposase n=1 Tax=Streptomyces sp. WM6386 TaxID=1415558 RepID=UPI000BA252FB
MGSYRRAVAFQVQGAPFSVTAGPAGCLGGDAHRLRTGILWRDLPARFGPSGKVRPRQRTWLADGMWTEIMELLNEAGGGTPVLGYRNAPELRFQSDPGVVNPVRIS